MKQLTIFLLLFFSIVVSAQLRGPKIFTPNDTYDFGTIKQGDVAKHKFIIINNGDDLLKVINVTTSCGCTAAELDSKELAPAKSTTLSIEFNSAGKLGPQNKTISIFSNDTTKPYFKLTMKGNIIESDTKEIVKLPKIVFETETKDFGQVIEGTQLEYTFKFKNAGEAILEIQDVKTSCGCTAAKPSATSLEAGKSADLSMVFDTANRSGKVTRTITVQSNDPDHKYKVLTIFAEINKKGN